MNVFLEVSITGLTCLCTISSSMWISFLVHTFTYG